MLGHLNRFGQPAIASKRRDTIDELGDFRCGQRPLEAVNGLALPEGIDGRDRLDTQLRRDHLVLVDVDLDHLDPPLGRGDRRLKCRTKLLAGSAPRGPEIDDHRNFAARVNDIGHERGL